MNKLKTATGKEYPCDFMGVATGYDVLYVKLEIDMNEVMEVFQNPEETETLEWLDGITGDLIMSKSGYTDFGGFNVMRGECPIRVRMMRPYGNGGV